MQNKPCLCYIKEVKKKVHTTEELYSYYVEKEKKFKEAMTKKDFIINYIEELSSSLNEDELVANAVYAQMQHEKERGMSITTNYFNSIIASKWRTFRKDGLRYIDLRSPRKG